MEQSINPHAYCRLRFDEAAEEAIENLANVLQWHRNSAHEGLFVAQKDARAGTSLARQSSSSSSVFERIRSIFFLFYARLSLSLSARVLMSAKENAAFRCSLFSLLSAGVRLRASKEREREREMENFLEASLSLWKKNLEISFSAHQIKTHRERERESDRFDERVDQKRRA